MKSVFNKALIIALCLSISSLYAGGVYAHNYVAPDNDAPRTSAHIDPVVNPSVVNPSVQTAPVTSRSGLVEVPSISRPAVHQGWFARTYQNVANTLDKGLDSVIDWVSANRKKTYAAMIFANAALKVERETGDISRGVAHAGHFCSQVVKNLDKKTLDGICSVGLQVKNILSAGAGNIALLASALKNHGKTAIVNHPYLCVGGVLGVYGLTLAVIMRRARIRAQREAELADLSSDDEQDLFIVNDSLFMRLSRRTSQSQPDSFDATQVNVTQVNIAQVNVAQVNVVQEVAADSRPRTSEDQEVSATNAQSGIDVASVQPTASTSEEQNSDTDEWFDAQESFLVPSSL